MKDLFAKRLLFSVQCYKGTKLMKKTILSALTAIIAGMAPLSVSAQDIAPQPCDAQYWRQLTARAWLEAEREIMQNQNLIFKPDSVLEYVCFDQFASIAAWTGGDIFVHTKYFGKQIITRGLNPGAMETGIAAVVSTALASYKGSGNDSNFGHEFLGGRAGKMNAAMTNSSFKPATEKQAYNCQTMSKVWKAAKCANFVDNSNFEKTDGFYPFKAIKGHGKGKSVGGYEDTIKETRKWPTECGALNAGQAHADQESKGTWTNQLELAENKNLYEFKSPLGKIFKEVGEKIEPGKCGQTGISTGVMVIVDGKESHVDGVCTNPGCTYTKGGKDTPGKCS